MKIIRKTHTIPFPDGNSPSYKEDLQKFEEEWQTVMADFDKAGILPEERILPPPRGALFLFGSKMEAEEGDPPEAHGPRGGVLGLLGAIAAMGSSPPIQLSSGTVVQLSPQAGTLLNSLSRLIDSPKSDIKEVTAEIVNNTIKSWSEEQLGSVSAELTTMKTEHAKTCSGAGCSLVEVLGIATELLDTKRQVSVN